MLESPVVKTIVYRKKKGFRQTTLSGAIYRNPFISSLSRRSYSFTLDIKTTVSTWNERIASLSLPFGNLRKYFYARFSVLSVCGNISSVFIARIIHIYDFNQYYTSGFFGCSICKMNLIILFQKSTFFIMKAIFYCLFAFTNPIK